VEVKKQLLAFSYQLLTGRRFDVCLGAVFAISLLNHLARAKLPEADDEQDCIDR
jgi:hypothetical protein